MENATSIRPHPLLSLTPLPTDCLNQLAGSLKKQWKRYRKELKRCQSKFSEKAIHDFRVEARRLLATVDLLTGFLSSSRIKKITRLIKRHLDAFDELRDLQVQLQAVKGMRRQFTAARQFHLHLCKREKRAARDARKDAESLETGRLAKLISESRAQVEKESATCASARANRILLRTVTGAFRQTRKLRAQIDPLDTKSIHCTRVAFKKFRYMVEALACCKIEAREASARKQTEAYLESLHDYQTLMGDIQDAEVFLTAVDKYLCKQEIEPEAAGSFRKELLHRKQRLIQRYLNSASKLDGFWTIKP